MNCSLPVSFCLTYNLRRSLVGKSRLLLVLSNQFFEISFRSPHVFHLLRTRNLPLDGDGAAIVHLLQTRDNARKIHLTLTDGNFLAEFPRVRRPKSVLAVNPLHVGAEQFDGVPGIR